MLSYRSCQRRFSDSSHCIALVRSFVMCSCVFHSSPCWLRFLPFYCFSCYPLFRDVSLTLFHSAARNVYRCLSGCLPVLFCFSLFLNFLIVSIRFYMFLNCGRHVLKSFTMFLYVSFCLYLLFSSISSYLPLALSLSSYLSVSHARPGYRCFSLFCSIFLVLPNSLCFTVISCVPLCFSLFLCGEERKPSSGGGPSGLERNGKRKAREGGGETREVAIRCQRRKDGGREGGGYHPGVLPICAEEERGGVVGRGEGRREW